MSKPGVSSRTLLMIDDDQAMLDLIRSLIAENLTTMWTTTDPHDGLRLAMIHRPSLILLDNQMPEITGLEILHQLRTMPSTAHIPVIMLTADSSLKSVQAAASDQVQGYLVKPCELKTLFETLNPWLELGEHSNG